MGNGALQANPPVNATQHITVRGSDWLWAVFAIMLFTDLVILIWHFMIPRGQRVFHQLSVVILTTAAVAYFSMASNLGYTGIATEFNHSGSAAGTLRQIWYVRYIDWTITTPLLLLELVLVSGLPLSDIFTLIFFDILMIEVGLVGALVKSSYKWGYWTFGMFALFYIWWVLVGPARTSAGLIGPGFKKSFTQSAILLSFLWLLYPIAWGFADGSAFISADSEMVWYGILDVLAKPVFCLFHLWSLSKLDLTALQLSSGKFSTSAVGGGVYDAEKTGRFANTPAASGHITSTPGHTAATPVAGHKKGLFGRKGRYDAPTNTTAGTTASPIIADGRPSEATVAA